MGLCLCSGTKHFIEETENRFWVINVNDDGKKICPGIMELTETCLMFYPKKGGLVRWPYISLVKYGYDSNLFSFVCGRRCATGEGIFGFRCMRAEDLFNMLQNNMQNNRISIISDTDSEFPTCAYNVPYRYETYSAVFTSSQRPEPIFGDFVRSSVTPSLDQSYMTSVYKENRMQQRCLSVERKNSEGGNSQASSRYSNIEVEEWNHYQKASVLLKSQFKNDAMEMLNTNGDFIYANWDTGYDSDERKERCYFKRREYENIVALPKECFRSRSLLPSVSSSDSHNTNCVPIKLAEGGYESQPSSPSVFEEKYSLEQNNPLLSYECNPPRQTLFKRCSFGQESLNLSDRIPTYFNFDVKQISQNTEKLNYIQVELESGCDSENPQTPQSPDMAISFTTGQQSEFYAELDLEKTAALSSIQKHRQHDDGTRKTRHNSKYFFA